MSLKSLLLIFVLFTISFVQASAESYEIPEIQVEVKINPDGTVHITEHLTYNFDGDFSWAEYKLPKRGFSSISDIRIFENGQAYINENSENIGTYSVSKSDDTIRLKWYYNANDERRTFTISYTLKGAVVVGTVWSEFFWNYVSADRDKSTDQLDISIKLPLNIAPDSLYAWTRGPQANISLEKEPGSYSVLAKNIGENEFVKVRLVFPSKVFEASKVSVIDTGFSLQQAQQNEQTYHENVIRERERHAYMAEIWGKLNYLIALLSIGIFYFLYNKFGKRNPTSRFSSAETIMIPGQVRPAAAGWLLNGRGISGGLLMATVLDLARRGYFKIQELPAEEGFLSDAKPKFAIERTDQDTKGDVLRWEKQLIRFIEDRLKEDKKKLHELFKESSSSVSNWFTEWKHSFKKYCFNQGWVDEKSYTGAYWNGGLQTILLCASIAALVFAGPISLLSAGITLTTLILSFSIIRRTPEGEEVYHRWKNYRRGLKNAKNYSVSSDQLDKHFTYGVAFGMQGKQIEGLISSGSDGVPAFWWFVFAGNTNSPEAAASAFSTLGATGSASFSGAVGGGGGASAGAAGGGASASAG